MTLTPSYRGSVVVLFGPIGSGKSTTAKALMSYGFQRVSFADELRREISSATNVPVSAMLDPATKEEYRPILQWWGSHRRASNQDYWIQKLLPNLDNALPKKLHLVIDDCRYANEYLALKQYGSVFFSLGPNPNITPSPSTHESERDWQSFVYSRFLPWMPPADRAKEIVDYLTMQSLY